MSSSASNRLGSAPSENTKCLTQKCYFKYDPELRCLFAGVRAGRIVDSNGEAFVRPDGSLAIVQPDCSQIEAILKDTITNCSDGDFKDLQTNEGSIFAALSNVTRRTFDNRHDNDTETLPSQWLQVRGIKVRLTTARRVLPDKLPAGKTGLYKTPSTALAPSVEVFRKTRRGVSDGPITRIEITIDGTAVRNDDIVTLHPRVLDIYSSEIRELIPSFMANQSRTGESKHTLRTNVHSLVSALASAQLHLTKDWLLTDHLVIPLGKKSTDLWESESMSVQLPHQTAPTTVVVKACVPRSISERRVEEEGEDC